MKVIVEDGLQSSLGIIQNQRWVWIRGVHVGTGGLRESRLVIRGGPWEIREIVLMNGEKRYLKGWDSGKAERGRGKEGGQMTSNTAVRKRLGAN